MKFVRKVFCVLPLLVLLLSGCSKKSAENTNASYKPGTYASEAQGMNGLVKVEVTVDADKILAVKITDHAETPGISDGAFKKIPQTIVNEQSLAVDVYSGATFTSKAILDAAEKALIKSGVDIQSLKIKTEKKLTQGQTETTDIVIVGAGISGILAAYELQQNHSDIQFVLLEKLPTVGGSLVATGGAIFGTDSAIHKKDGVKSSIEQIVSFFEITSKSKSVNEDLVRAVYGFSANTLDMLADLGAPYIDKTEKVDPSNNELFSLRMVNKGKGFYDFIKEEVEQKKPFDLRLESRVTELIVQNGAVQGVIVEDKNTRYKINAQAVILATGGFGSNTDLMKKYAPNYADGVIATNAGATGDGLLFCEQFGTRVFGDGTMGSFVNPDRSDLLSTSFMVNKTGRRFTNEKAPKYVVQRDIADLPEHRAFALLDGSFANKDALQKAETANTVKRFNTLEELAQYAGINAENLKAEVDSYNSALEKNQSPGFGLPASQAAQIKTAPFYLQTAVVRTFGTIPGIEVDSNARVLGKDGAVPGLYASGELIAANAFNRRYPGVGIGISFAGNSGRLAAVKAAEQLK